MQKQPKNWPRVQYPLNYGYHKHTLSIHFPFFQTKHFTAMKFYMGYEKKLYIWAFLWYQNLQKLEKKFKDRTGLI